MENIKLNLVKLDQQRNTAELTGRISYHQINDEFDRVNHYYHLGELAKCFGICDELLTF